MSTQRHAELLDSLSRLILELGVGKRLPPQDQLAKRYKVSRTLLREALVILEYLGVIRMKTKSGTHVTDPLSWAVSNNALKKLQIDMIYRQQEDLQ